MPDPQALPPVTICLLLYGDHFSLARRALDSIRRFCPRAQYHLTVGANAVCSKTQAFVAALRKQGHIDRLVVSPTNINKCPMMRRMFARIRTEYIWWFDDDSYFTRSAAFSKWQTVARAAPPSTVMWGCPAVCNHPDEFTCRHDAIGFVRQAKWYRGLPPPSPRPGGKGEFDFEGRGTGDGRWFFLVGGCWLIRTRAVRTLHWPDRRLIKMGDDVFLGEAIRQHGWRIAAIQSPGIAINTEPRRGLIG